MIWLALIEVCYLDLSVIPNYPLCVEKFLIKNTPDQKTFKIIYRHGLENDYEFKIKSGFKIFRKSIKLIY